MWIVPISSKGQLTLPIALRQTLGVKGGSDRVVLNMKHDHAVLTSAKGTLSDLKGILATHPKRYVPWAVVRKQAQKARATHIAHNE